LCPLYPPLKYKGPKLREKKKKAERPEKTYLSTREKKKVKTQKKVETQKAKQRDTLEPKTPEGVTTHIETPTK